MSKLSEMQKGNLSLMSKGNTEDLIPTNIKYKQIIENNANPEMDAKTIIEFMDQSAKKPLSDCHLTNMGFYMEKDGLTSVLSYLNDTDAALKGEKAYPDGCGTVYQAEKDGNTYEMYLYFKSNGKPEISGMEVRFIRNNIDGTIDRYFPETNSWERSEGLEEIKKFANSSESAKKYSRMLEEAATRAFPFLEEENMLKMCRESMPILDLAEKLGDDRGLKILAYVDENGEMDGEKSHAALALPDSYKFGTAIYYENNQYKICQEHLPKQDKGNMLILRWNEKWFHTIAETGKTKDAEDLLYNICQAGKKDDVCAVFPLSEHAYITFTPSIEGFTINASIQDGCEPTEQEYQNIEYAKEICCFGDYWDIDD